MKKLLIAISALLLSQGVDAQRERDNWIFGGGWQSVGNFSGNTSGGFNLNSQGTITNLNQNGNVVGDLQGNEGGAVVTDPRTGNLLFYTDGRYAFDENHNQVFPTTQNPNTPLGASTSATQAVTVCPKPVCPFDEYYVFLNALGVEQNNNGNLAIPNPSIYYRTYNSSSKTFSSTTKLDVPTWFTSDRFSESVSLIPHATDPLQYWLVTRMYFDQPMASGGQPVPMFLVYNISSTGISSPQLFSFGITLPSNNGNYISQSTFSDNATADKETVKIAWTYNEYTTGVSSLNARRNGIISCDFNAKTGTFITNTYRPEDISNSSPNLSTNSLYDLEFSPNGEYLYYSYYNNVQLFQHDMGSNSSVEITGFSSTGQRGGGLQTGADGNIYHVLDGSTSAATTPMRIGRITNPDQAFQNINGFYEEDVFVHSGVWGYNLPEFVTTPIWKASVVVTDGELCETETTLLESEIDVMGVGISGYRWYKNGQIIPGADQDELVAEGPGIYTIEVLLDGGEDCSIISDEAIIEESTDCCFKEYENQAFLTIYDQPTTISKNTIWDHKVIIKDGVIVTIDGAILDVTNVDVVFGDCAGIDFINGAVIRSNNSVYRPCEYQASWRGLRFQDSNDGVMNECTFKNAQTAMHFEDGNNQEDNVTVRITNNLFSNCQSAVTIENSIFQRNISGNTFQVGQDVPASYCSMGVMVYQGIQLRSVDFEGGQIIQNDFNMARNNFFIGVSANNFQNLEIISNKLSNNTAAISIRNGSDVNIKDNEIIFTDDHFLTNWNTAIFINNMTDCEITGNKMDMDSDVNNLNYDSGNQSAIRTLNSSNLSFINNHINNFESGLDLRSSTNLNVIENNIENAWFYGVYGDDIQNTLISCNEIQMESKKANINAIGIGVVYDDEYFFSANDDRNMISNNCIKEADVAIFSMGQNTGLMSSAPIIRNNYLYNYQTDGVLLDGVDANLSLGSQLTNQNASKNTFVSNNTAGGAFDIRVMNGTTANVYGSSGISTISQNVTIIGNGAFVSTASCGNQAGVGLNIILDELDYCEPRVFAPAVAPSNSQITVYAQQEEKATATSDEAPQEQIIAEGTSIDLFPNPANDAVTVALKNAESTAVQLKLINSHGQELLATTLEANVMNYTFDVSNFASGYYIVTIVDGNGVQKRAKLLID